MYYTTYHQIWLAAVSCMNTQACGQTSD